MHAAPSGTETILPYRADIDGLRAVSVIAVVLYHFGVPYFDGGFVGVDVFFVVSGYLITGIILAELREGRFDFARFYERRARRLLPTLAVVLVTAFVVSLAVMTPQDFEEFSRSMFYTLVFAANFFFDSQGGYFGPDLELAPLLHTWSLAVEEQFYIVWPVVLWLAFRYLPRWIFPLAGLLLLASLYASISLVEVKQTAAFYRPHARAWELLAGCILALGAPRVRGIVADLMSIAGLSLILFAVFTYSRDTLFPGAAAIVPVLGAVLVIWSGQSAPSLAGRILSLPALVFVGLVSYAWYLWHWPMIALFRYQLERDPSAAEIVLLLVASFTLAVLCWRFVETPIRRGARWKSRTLTWKATLAASAGMLMLAGAGYATEGFIDRYPEAVRELSRKPLSKALTASPCLAEAPGTDPDNVVCRLWDAGSKAPEILLWGDSHANVLRAVFHDIGRSSDVNVSYAGGPICPPMIGVGRMRSRGGQDRCADTNASVGNLIARHRFSDVVLAARWNFYAVGSDDKHEGEDKFFRDASTRASSIEENRAVITRGLRRTVEAIQATGARVWIVLETPFVGFDAPNRLARSIMRGDHPQTLFGIDVATERRRSAFMRELVAGLPVQVIEPAESLCESGYCLAVSGGKPLYFDDNHLSIYGTARLEPTLRDALARALANGRSPDRASF